MTTEEMRKSCIDNFDAAIVKLRAVVSDGDVSNSEYRPLKDAIADVQYAINRILRVNGAIDECKGKATS